jgi:arylsulfatase
MHVVTHLSEKYTKMRTAQNGWTISEAGMAQLDDIVGAVLKKLDDFGVADNTIVVFTTDNGAENFSWPDGGQTPFAGGKGTVLEGGFRVPCIVRWPGHIPAGKVENDVMSGLDWFPTLVAAAGDPHIVDELLKGKKLGDKTYKAHLDGYDQTALLTGKGPSKRKEIFYFAEAALGAVRIGDYKYRFIDQPQGWLGGTTKPDWPIITNLRLDPYERTGLTGSLEYTNWMQFQFWRFVFVQEVVGTFAKTFLDFPPLQKPATFNLDAIKEKVQTMAASHAGK